MSSKQGEIWKNPRRCFMCFVLEKIADYNNLKDFFAMYGFNQSGLGKIESEFEI